MKNRIRKVMTGIFFTLLLGVIFSFNVKAAGSNLSTATTLEVGTAYSETIEDETDYFKFTLSENSIIKIYAKTEGHDQHACISLLNSKGEEVSFFFSTDDDSNWGYQTGSKKYGLNKGTYYIEVNRYYGDVTNYSIKVSTITKTTSNVKVAGYENVYKKDAVEFSIGNKLTSIAEENTSDLGWSYDESHFYKFKVNKKRNVVLKFYTPISSNYKSISFYIYDSSGDAITSGISCNSDEDEHVETLKKTLSAGTYYIGVKTTYSSVPYTIKTAYKPYATKITSLKSNSKNSLTVKWKKKSSTTGYQIQYSRNSNFKNAKSVKVSGSKGSKKITGLKGGKKYYVRVRRYKKSFGTTYYSNWSAKKSVKIKSVNTIKSVKLSATRWAYNGKARKPKVIVKDSAGNKVSSSYYTVKYAKGRKKVGKYKVTIKFKGKYSGTYTRYFHVVPKKTSIRSTSKTKNSITVKWYKRTAQTTGYEIRYSRNKNFSSYGTKKVKAKYSSKKITGLKAGTKYYIKIRTYKNVNGKKISSAWSKVKTVTTKSIVYTPRSIESRWVKSGAYSYKYNDGALLYKNSNGKVRTIVSDGGSDAVAVGPKVYYSKYDDTVGDVCVFVYNVNKKTRKIIAKPEYEGEALIFLGYYNNYIYCSVLDFYYGDDTAYKMNVNTSKKYTMNALCLADDAVQVGKYMAVGENLGDASAYMLQIFNLSKGKVIKKIDDCIIHTKISGKLYYAIEEMDSSYNCYYKIYKSDMDGSNRKYLTKVKSLFQESPAIGKNYVYYKNADETYCKKNYSTGKVTEISRNDYLDVWNEM